MKRTFTMNGKSYESMMDIARDLGKNRVYPKDFAKYGIVETTGEVEAPKAEEVKADKPTPVAEPEKAETKEVKKESKKAEAAEPEKKEEKKAAKKEKAEKKVEPVEAVDVDKVIGEIPNMTIIEFNDIVSRWGVDDLVALAEKAGVKTWDTIENNPIRKMRLLMEVKKFYYPNDKVPVEPASAWKGISLEALLTLADEKSLDYRKSNEEKIQRMWVIKSLNDAGVEPSEAKTDEAATTKVAEAV